ncbi:MAG: NapH/MauN family ferredoxin-type protein [Azonexus sp.]|nr:NapH/MauN family ferredoxin-type protein [Azonexus sp.]
MSSVHNKRFVDQIMVMFGRETKKPEQFTEKAIQVHQLKRMTNKEAFLNASKEAHRLQQLKSQKWRNRRWATLIFANLLFVISFALDIQILEGALTASRFVGFHLIDLNSALQVMLAHKHIINNLLIGTGTVLLLWVLLGGRTFCSWICPYHLLAEWAEKLHLYLAKKKLVTDQVMDRRLRTVFWVIFALLAIATGYTVYEAISPTGILSRALIYGPGLAVLWVLALLFFEVFFSRRAWCRYACPIGLTYGVVGIISPVRVKYKLESCFHEGDCRKVCLVPPVLDTVIKGRAVDTEVAIGPDCTRCGLGVDACPTGSLTFEVKGLSKLM